MATITWLNCPACKRRYYVETRHTGKDANWFCPYCKHVATESEFTVVPGGRGLNNKTTVLAVTKDIKIG